MNLLKSESETLSEIMNGSPLVLRADFMNQNPLPSMMKLFFNGKQLCSSPKGKQKIFLRQNSYNY